MSLCYIDLGLGRIDGFDTTACLAGRALRQGGARDGRLHLNRCYFRRHGVRRWRKVLTTSSWISRSSTTRTLWTDALDGSAMLSAIHTKSIHLRIFTRCASSTPSATSAARTARRLACSTTPRLPPHVSRISTSSSPSATPSPPTPHTSLPVTSFTASPPHFLIFHKCASACITRRCPTRRRR